MDCIMNSEFTVLLPVILLIGALIFSCNSSYHYAPSSVSSDRNPQKRSQTERAIRIFYMDESGASSVEYAILVTGIAVAIISAVVIFGQGVKGLFTQANTKFP